MKFRTLILLFILISSLLPMPVSAETHPISTEAVALVGPLSVTVVEGNTQEKVQNTLPTCNTLNHIAEAGLTMATWLSQASCAALHVVIASSRIPTAQVVVVDSFAAQAVVFEHQSPQASVSAVLDTTTQHTADPGYIQSPSVVLYAEEESLVAGEKGVVVQSVGPKTITVFTQTYVMRC